MKPKILLKEDILNILKSKGVFVVSRYRYGDENLRKRLRKMKKEGLIKEYHNEGWKMRDIIAYELVDNPQGTVLS